MTNELEDRFAEVISSVEKLTSLASSLSSGQVIAFSPVTLMKPYLLIPIHGFYTSVSWFYVLYFEAGRSSVDFLAERSYGLGFDGDHRIAKHLNLIESFRTYLQHNLDLGNRGDVAKRHNCHDWIRECLHSNEEPEFLWPQTSEEWNNLIRSLLVDAIECLRIMLGTLDAISSDESRQSSLDVWLSRVRRSHAAYEYDDIIEDVATDFGMRFIDPIIIRNKYYSRWNSKMALLKGTYDFREQARLMIEHTLLNEVELPVPISGRDIMTQLGINAGPEVKRLKAEAQRLYNEKPSNKEEIMEKLRLFVSDN
jgi:hypothetical protein